MAHTHIYVPAAVGSFMILDLLMAAILRGLCGEKFNLFWELKFLEVFT